MCTLFTTLKTTFLAFLLLSGSIFAFLQPARAAEYPKRANYFLKWDLTDSEVKELSKWDVVIIDMENQLRNPEKIKKLREYNPKIVILAYITMQEVRDDAATGPGEMRRRLVSGITSDWYFYDKNGQKMSFWPETSMLNITNSCPIVNGQRFNTYLARFVSDQILGTGLWDGVFYDNGWGDVTWFSGDRGDFNRDGIAEVKPEADALWRDGVRTVFESTRQLLVNKNYLIVANQGPGHKYYRDDVNGVMFENFPQFGWNYTMDLFQYQSKSTKPHLIVINANTRNTGKKDDYKTMRFGLMSSMLEDNAYYSFDFGDQRHGELWWYDEYDVNIGTPVAPALSQKGQQNFVEDVWRRDYTNGVAVVNATSQAQMVDLGGEYEKIIGKQDKITNDGSIVDVVNVAPKDGLMMLKTFQTVHNAVFNNGSFLRFFDITGKRARNGFFVFEEGYAGGAKMYQGDLNGDGNEEKIIVTGPKLEIFDSNGGVVLSERPFGNNYSGDMNIAVGKLFSGDNLQIVVAPATGGKIVVYSPNGKILNPGIYPFGEKYVGGFSVGIVPTVGGRAEGAIVLGATQPGKPNEILVYDSRLSKIMKRFTTFDKSVKTVLIIAVGDINNDGKVEIAALPLTTKLPIVKLFDTNGKAAGQFKVSTSFVQGPMVLSIADANKDGVLELMVMNK